jgi:hypothetical protein
MSREIELYLPLCALFLYHLMTQGINPTLISRTLLLVLTLHAWPKYMVLGDLIHEKFSDC